MPVEGAGRRTFDTGFTTPNGTLILVDAKRTALIHKGALRVQKKFSLREEGCT